jgi:hypothetical protein
MIFYHFTSVKNLFGISAHGLTPCDGGVMTMGREVVWVTRQETLKPTQADPRR